MLYNNKNVSNVHMDTIDSLNKGFNVISYFCS